MTIPAKAKFFDATAHPRDLVDWEIELKQGATGDTLLQVGEGLASYTLTLGSEGPAVGLSLREDGGYSTTYTPGAAGGVVKFWTEVAAASQSLAAFDSEVSIPVELGIVTNNVPPRKRYKTYVFKLVRQ